MKCPYCGADVVPNTKCEYCNSFVEKEEKETNSSKEYSEILGEFIAETAKHLEEGIRTASNNVNYSNNASRANAESYEETVKRVSSPENKQILKKLLIVFCILIAAPILFYIIFAFFTLWSSLFVLF